MSAGCGLARPAAGCSHTAAFSFTLASDRKPPAQRWTGRGNQETEQNKTALAEQLHHCDDDEAGDDDDDDEDGTRPDAAEKFLQFLHEAISGPHFLPAPATYLARPRGHAHLQY